MHEDMTEHVWKSVMVLEQGQYMVATTICVDCGLTTYDLLEDQLHEALRSMPTGSVPDADGTSGDGTASSSASDAGSSSRAAISDEAYAVQHMNLMFSGVALGTLDHRVEG